MRLLIISVLMLLMEKGNAQCSGGINTFPYTEEFENSDGGWVSGGTGNDWAWGTPNKSIIQTAGGGSRCWITGGLTGTGYTNAEASWLQSPCFDFTNLRYPFIAFKLNWETEQQFDGGSFQYSIDNGNTWVTLGRANYTDCVQKNWFNQDPITYLSPLTSERRGWSGTTLPTAGNCRGGNGSNGWVTAQTIAPDLALKPSVIFRFIFGAGTICNNYDGFAVDDIFIGEAQSFPASFTYLCTSGNTAGFTNTSASCLTTISWNFGDPGSGAGNTSNVSNPSHIFSAPGKYTVSLTVSAPGIPTSTITREITIVDISVTMVTMADCINNNGGSLIASVTGTTNPLNLVWSTSPVQTSTLASNLGAGTYTVTVTGTDVCTASATGKVETDFSCIGIYFPSAFTPNNDGKNDKFGPLGSLAALTKYRLSIYNRWGEKIFTSTNPFDKWDGRVKGEKTDGNLFIWMAEFDLPGKQRELRKGTVVLVR